MPHRLKTSHGTFLGFDETGRIYHADFACSNEQFGTADLIRQLLSFTGAGSLTISEGPADGGLALFLDSGQIAFYLNGRYLTADAYSTNANFQADRIDWWERFTIVDWDMEIPVSPRFSLAGLMSYDGSFVITSDEGELRLSNIPPLIDDEDNNRLFETLSYTKGNPFNLECRGFDDGEVIFLDDDRICFRKGGKFLQADTTSGKVHYSGDFAGPWEMFSLVDAGEKLINGQKLAFIPFNHGNYRVSQKKITQPTVEFLRTPIVIAKGDDNWLKASHYDVFPLKPGAHSIAANTIWFGKGKFISTGSTAQGVIFDHSGFYYNIGFLNDRFHMNSMIRSGDGYFIDQNNTENYMTIRGEYTGMFDGTSTNNYYHWLVEFLLYTFLLKKAGVSGKPIISTPNLSLSKWQKDYLDILEMNDYVHIDSDKVEFAVVEKLNWIENRDLSAFGRKEIVAFRDHILSKVQKSSSKEGGKIYVKRRSKVRGIANARELESLLIKKGFEILCMEDHSVREQIEIFRSARVILGAHGAGLSNIIFCSKSSILIELMPEEAFRGFFWYLAEMLEIDYCVLRCPSTMGHAGELTVDIKSVNRALQYFYL